MVQSSDYMNCLLKIRVVVGDIWNQSITNLNQRQYNVFATVAWGWSFKLYLLKWNDAM